MERLEPNVFVEFEMGEALPASKRLSCWISTLSLVFNDAILDSINILRSEGRADELSYFMRIAAGHLYEAAKFVANTAGWPEVKELVERLDEARKADWDSIEALWDRDAPLRPSLDNARHQVFHYPKVYETRGLGEVTAALERMSGGKGNIALGSALGSYRFQFADALALDMIIEPDPDTEQRQFEEFADGLREGVLALQRCSEAVLALYFSALGPFVEVPPREAA